uniref:Retinol dehydrogenase 14 n=1 Tax=Acrobeloides nanus TaxID=290746 RepID=A0A914CVB7_9BILA
IKPSAPLDEKLNKLTPNPSEDIGMMDAYRLYSISKLCNVLFALKAHRLEHENGINTYVLHPGIIPTTSLLRSIPTLSSIVAFVSKPFTKNFEQGAATTVYCAASPFVENESGRYYADCNDAEKDLHKDLARDESLQDALWSKSLEFIKKFEGNNVAHF